MPATATQQKVYIEDIQDGILVLKDGSLRAIVMTSSVNFALKSTEEQDALIYKYQGFLNSLDFPVQILATSRHLNISDYLAMIEQRRREQPNELLRIQIAEYIDFIKNLVQMGNIMGQSFYVVVPLSRVEKKEANIIEKLGIFQKKTDEKEKSLEELKTQLWQRVEYVIAGLAGIGIKTTPLNTEEAAELFYRLYNMEAKEAPTITTQQNQQ
jgi:ribosomal protein S16